MKKIISLMLAAMLLFGCCGVLAEADVPEGYPEVIEGLDFGGQTIYIYDWWSSDDENHSARSAEPDEETQKLYEYRDWLEKEQVAFGEKWPASVPLVMPTPAAQTTASR